MVIYLNTYDFVVDLQYIQWKILILEIFIRVELLFYIQFTSAFSRGLKKRLSVEKASRF